MAKFKCKCGTVTRDDDPDHGLLMFRSRDYEDDAVAGLGDLLGRCMQVIDCPTCGRLWVWWERRGDAPPTQYTRQPPDPD
ncbi:hypothetical protein AB0A63_15850 [Lentzea sp. NPDC042327]|uniref:hypothetical protein n=1 Tax=Lentzea sp. NPDC042327 TaxID=3154801 RepID=UPI0033DC9DF5